MIEAAKGSVAALAALRSAAAAVWVMTAQLRGEEGCSMDAEAQAEA
ncbi:MAG: hypothetical protein BroJett013_04170 [Alphaproteobacteria bacterium]|nr:MAG: hypothetical protein BroJett013_04170 [Alphaproteobacteria bacterium]